jgi:hypothetical protein
MPVSDILISPYRACLVISKARRRPGQIVAFCTGPGCDTDGQQKCVTAVPGSFAQPMVTTQTMTLPTFAWLGITRAAPATEP